MNFTHISAGPESTTSRSRQVFLQTLDDWPAATTSRRRRTSIPIALLHHKRGHSQHRFLDASGNMPPDEHLARYHGQTRPPCTLDS